METQVEIRSEEESKHRLEMAEMEHQLVLELRALGDILEILRLRDRARESPKLQGMMDVKTWNPSTFEKVVRAHEVPGDQWHSI